MKRVICCILLVFTLFPFALAEDIDLSGMTLDELLVLRQRVQFAMVQTDEWQAVRVPVGVWEIGKDIPAGHWSITAASDTHYTWGTITYCDKLDAAGKGADRWGSTVYYHSQVKAPDSDASVEATTIDLDCKEGTYVILEYSAMIFTPYSGKPDLGFK